jgi:hypothetical protein
MKLYLRTAEEKADPGAWWRQPDERFFAAGGSHILAGTFLQRCSKLDFYSLLIQPLPGFRVHTLL